MTLFATEDLVIHNGPTAQQLQEAVANSGLRANWARFLTSDGRICVQVDSVEPDTSLEGWLTVRGKLAGAAELDYPDCLWALAGYCPNSHIGTLYLFSQEPSREEWS